MQYALSLLTNLAERLFSSNLSVAPMSLDERCHYLVVAFLLSRGRQTSCRLCPTCFQPHEIMITQGTTGTVLMELKVHMCRYLRSGLGFAWRLVAQNEPLDDRARLRWLRGHLSHSRSGGLGPATHSFPPSHQVVKPRSKDDHYQVKNLQGVYPTPGLYELPTPSPKNMSIFAVKNEPFKNIFSTVRSLACALVFHALSRSCFGAPTRSVLPRAAAPIHCPLSASSRTKQN